MASPDEQDYLRDQLRIHRIPAKKIMYDVGEVIRRTSKGASISRIEHSYREAGNNQTRAAAADLLGAGFYSRYQPYTIIEAKLKHLANSSPKVSLEVAGLSYEKRNIYLVKVSNNPTANKPVIFIDAGHHAREWISHSTLIYILESLINDNMPEYDVLKSDSLDSLSTNTIELQPAAAAAINDESQVPNLKKSSHKSLKTYLDKYDFWFLPVVNPDGYAYTHSTDRLWRKTRSRSGYCIGVDPNRNYPFHWGESGSSTFSCSETYAGPKALSEPECALLASTLINNQQRIKAYLTLHAYSQLMLVPYGHDRVYPENYAELNRVAQAGINAIASFRGTKYQFGTSAVLLYPAAGGSDDYAYGQANIKLSYTIELPDNGRYGFLLPPSEIVPVGQETVLGISAMIESF